MWEASRVADGGGSPVGQSRNKSVLTLGSTWFALTVSGVIVLLAMPFYDSSSKGCSSLSPGALICQRALASKGLFGPGLGSSDSGLFGNSSPWATTYWVVSIFIGVCCVVLFYWSRSREPGHIGRLWPIVAIVLSGLILVGVSRDWLTSAPSDLTVRGMQALLVIAIGLIVLAVIDRKWAFSLFVGGFLGLALLSCLYNVSNLFQRFGIAKNWAPNELTLPNLILPGTYLLLGGAAFITFHHLKVRKG